MTTICNRIVCFLILLASTCLGAAETSSISSNLMAPAVNQSFTVTVTMTATAGYSCWGQALTWDTSKVRLDSQEGLSSPLGTVVADSRTLSVIQASGQVRTGGYYQAAGPSYPDHGADTGAVAVFNFTRIAGGSTTLNCPVKSSGEPFGLVFINAAGAERSPTASALTLDEPLVTQAPVITSTAVTTATANITYTYDVNASGTPVPTYSLATAPAGMTINTTTGVITWTPTSASNAAVTVQAANGVDPVATQSFTIVVEAASNGDAADRISVNIGAPIMAVSESAGVVPETHWTTITSETSSALIDGNGTATSATHAFTSPNWGWATNNEITDVAGNQRMLRGYIDQTLGVSHDISDIPFTTYDLYLYFDRDNNTGIASFVHKFTITDGVGTVLAGPFFARDPANTAFSGFVEVPVSSTTDLQGATPAGNYLHITGLTASSIHIVVGASSDSWGQSGFSRSGIGGFQIIRSSSLATVATPTFTPAPGTYSAAQSVTVATSTAGATIHVTTDGSTPTALSASYTGPISVTSTTTIKALATATGMTNSAVSSAMYTITIPPPPPSSAGTPTFTPAPGTYSSAQTVTITCDTAGATIYFTTDGSTPSLSSAAYTGPINVASTTTIQALSTANLMSNSAVSSARYILVPGTTTGTTSPNGTLFEENGGGCGGGNLTGLFIMMASILGLRQLQRGRATP